MNEILINLIKGRPIAKQDIVNALYAVCQDVHSSCSAECPVYEINNNAPYKANGSHFGCDCFKNGEAMFDFIKKYG